MELKNWEDKFIQWWHDNASDDASHDLSHFQRVYKIALQISKQENAGDPLILLAAAYFHDIVNPPKDSPLRSKASKLAAEKSREILTEMNFPADKISGIEHAIEAHSFSANIPATTIEAKIVQDADRMESLGAMGLARTMYVNGSLGRTMFDPEDPLAENGRELDEKKYGLDHFKTKLLKLPAMMQTDSGRKMAEQRAEYLKEFQQQLLREIRCEF